MIINGLVALVKSVLGSSIPGLPYPVMLPEGVPLPAVTYQVVASSSRPTFNTPGMQKLRVQFDCFGMTYADAASVSGALAAGLDGFVGVLTDGMELQDVQVIQQFDRFDNTARQYRSVVEMYLYFNQ